MPLSWTVQQLLDDLRDNKTIETIAREYNTSGRVIRTNINMLIRLYHKAGLSNQAIAIRTSLPLEKVTKIVNNWNNSILKRRQEFEARHHAILRNQLQN